MQRRDRASYYRRKIVRFAAVAALRHQTDAIFLDRISGSIGAIHSSIANSG